MTKKISTQKIKYFLFFLFLFYPSFRLFGFEFNILGKKPDWIMQPWSVFSFIVSVLWYLIKFPKKSDLPILFYVLYSLLISLYFKLTGNRVALTDLISFIATFFILICFARKNKKWLIDYLFLFFSILCIINTLTFLPFVFQYFPTGNMCLIGHTQVLSMLWVVSLTLAFLKYNHFYKNPLPLLVLFLSTIYCIWAKIFIGFFVMIIFAILLIFFNKKFKHYGTITFILFLITLIFNFLFVFSNFQQQLKTILNIFRQDASFNGRDYIWAVFLNACSHSPIVGYGFEALSVTNWELENYYCHNTILQELSNGGIIQLVFFLFMIVSSIRKLQKNNCSVKTKKILSIGFICFCFIMVSESVTFYNYLSIIIVLMNESSRL